VTVVALTFRVAVKGAIFRDDRLLVLERRRSERHSDPYPAQTLDLPGGRLEFGEHPHAALEREIFEEVRLTVRIRHPVFVWTHIRDTVQIVGITFDCQYTSGDVTLSKEHSSFRWATEEEVMGAWPDKDEIAAIFEYHKQGRSA
jgi:8-oxo-dGTP diphosphatase